MESGSFGRKAETMSDAAEIAGAILVATATGSMAEQQITEEQIIASAKDVSGFREEDVKEIYLALADQKAFYASDAQPGASITLSEQGQILIENPDALLDEAQSVDASPFN